MTGGWVAANLDADGTPLTVFAQPTAEEQEGC
jgi:hypothetical protein